LTFKFTSPNNKGVPDRLFIRDGQIFFIEFKAPGKMPTMLQNHIIGMMELAGAVVHIVDDVSKLEEIIK
jgi:hypothetical protein